MQDNQLKTCLLIAPLTFYTFYKTLAVGLEDRGYSVDVINDEFPANFLGKLLGHIALPLLRRLTYNSLKKRLSKNKKYDLVLIIKGRGISIQAINYLKLHSRAIIGYNFDSFHYNPSPLDWYSLVDKYATFDIVDANRYSLPLVHLFSDAKIGEKDADSYHLSIVQKLHSDRLIQTQRIISSVPREWKMFIFLYESNFISFLKGVLCHPILYFTMLPYISFRPLPYEAAMEAICNSRVTIDFAHPVQTGITIRCFEAQSLGVSILTTNKYALDTNLFPSQKIKYLSPEASANLILEALNCLIKSDRLITTRSLDDFLQNLLSGV